MKHFSDTIFPGVFGWKTFGYPLNRADFARPRLHRNARTGNMADNAAVAASEGKAADVEAAIGQASGDIQIPADPPATEKAPSVTGSNGHVNNTDTATANSDAPANEVAPNAAATAAAANGNAPMDDASQQLQNVLKVVEEFHYLLEKSQQLFAGLR